MWPKYLVYLIHLAKIYGIFNKCGQNIQIRIQGNDNLETALVLHPVGGLDACMRVVHKGTRMCSSPEFWPESTHPQKAVSSFLSRN